MIGLKCSDGVVVGVERIKANNLQKAGTGRRSHTVDTKSGIAYTGYMADGRAIVSAAEAECANYLDYFGEEIPPHVLTERLAAYMHAHTCYGGYRPLGLGVLVFGYDHRDEEPYLHMIEPSGVHFRFHGVAVGKARQSAKTEIEKLNLDDLTCRQALEHIAHIIHLIRADSKDKGFEFEATWICQESEWKHEEVPKALRDEANAAAMKRVEDADMADD